MLGESFGLKIDDAGRLLSLPQIVDRYVPDLAGLPKFPLTDLPGDRLSQPEVSQLHRGVPAASRARGRPGAGGLGRAAGLGAVRGARRRAPAPPLPRRWRRRGRSARGGDRARE